MKNIVGPEAQALLEKALMEAEWEETPSSEKSTEKDINQTLADISKKLDRISSHLDTIVSKLEKEKGPSLLKG